MERIVSGNIVLTGLTMILLGVFSDLLGQCPSPRLYDLNYINASANPVWENCIDNTSDPDQFTLTLFSPEDIYNYTLDFGDGSAPVSGAFWEANTPISHVYNLGIYTLTLSETRNGCTVSITGRIINDRKAGATAIPPTEGTSGCVPHSLTFINQSTNVSPHTVFEWDWGDGTRDRVGPETVGQPITHVYERGRAGCNMVVSLTAFSLCDTTFSSYGPYDFWDIDTAVVTASVTRICVGQEITFTDQSLYNCNVRQPRRIRWNFTEVGGGITDWLPATPQNRSQTYFVSGNIGDRFTVFMEDSNYCGVDPAAVTVEIIGPPQASIHLPNPVICAGQEGVFQNTSTGGANFYVWDFGDGSPLYTTASSGQSRHVYNEPGTYTVKLLAGIDGTDMCRDSTTISIQVLPSSISDFTSDNHSGCAPVNVNVTDLSQNATSWQWTVDGIGVFTSQTPPELVFTDPGTYVIELTTSNSLGCGSKKTATISVYPTVSSIPEGDSACLGVPVHFTDKSQLSGASACATGNILYEKWDDITGSSVSDLTSGSMYPDHPSSSALLTTFEAPGNSGNNYGARIHGFICPPQTGNYVFWIASDDASELWLSTDASPDNAVLIASVSSYTSSREWTKFSSQQSASVYLESGRRYYIRALHKEGNGDDHLAVGWQLPSGTRERPIPGTRLAPFSEGSAITSWSWDFGNGIVSSVRNPVYTYPDAGSYLVQLTVSTGQCSSSAIIPVEIFPGVNTRIWQSDTAACSPLELALTDESVNAATYTWDFGDGTPVYHYAAGDIDTIQHVYTNYSGNDRIYYLSLIAASQDGCADTAYTSVRVYPAPKADFSYSPTVPQCSPIELNFTNISEAADSYRWYFGPEDSSSTLPAAFSKIFENKTTSVINDTITLKAFSNTGCYGEMSRVVTLYPEADFQILADPDTSCHPASVRLSASGGPVSFLWELGNGSISTSPSPLAEYHYTGTADTSYRIRFIGTSPFNCKDTAEYNIVVFPTPEAEFVADINSGCSPLSVSFQRLSQGTETIIADYGDGQIDTLADGAINFQHLFSNTSGQPYIYNVRLKVLTSAGCFDESTIQITVFPEVEAAFAHTSISGCSPLAVSFENLSVGATNFVWSLGGGFSTTTRNPAHEFQNNSSNDTTFKIILTAISPYGCRDQDSSEVVVWANPFADFITDITAGCSPLEINITNMARDYERISWSYGDGITEDWNEPANIYTYTNTDYIPKSVELTQTVLTDKGCGAVKKQLITLYPEVVALFESSDTAGCSPLNVRYTNYSIGADFYDWNFGDGNTSNGRHPVHSFYTEANADTIYLVTLTARSQYNCSATYSDSINVYSTPQAAINVLPDEGCAPLHVSIENHSTGATEYVWSFGDGISGSGSMTIPEHTYQNQQASEQAYTFALTATSSKGCMASVSRQITVFPEVKAAFTSTDTAGCTPWPVSFYNLSHNATIYSWNFDGINQSTATSPVHSFINQSNTEEYTYNVRLIASNGWRCQDTSTRQIVVYPAPEASFVIDNPAGCTPHTSVIRNNSTGATRYFWEYGNGQSDSIGAMNFFKTFDNELLSTKEYTIRLTAVSEHQCQSQTSRSLNVYPAVKAGFESVEAGCAPLKAEFRNTSTGASQYTWFLDNNRVSSDLHPDYMYYNESDKDTAYLVRLVAGSLYGCSDTLERTVTVYPRPQARFSVTPAILQLPDSVVSFENSSSTGNWWYSWDFGDNSGSQVRNPQQHYYTFYGDYTIRLIVGGDHCSDTAFSSIIVLPTKPIASFTGGDKDCGPLGIQFKNTSKYAERYEWDFGDGNKSPLKDPYHEYGIPGSYTVTLTVWGAGGEDQVSIRDVVEVYPIPTAFFKVRPEGVAVKIPGNSHYFSNMSENASIFHWDFGDGNTSEERNPFYEFKEPGIYDVTLLVSNEHGCENSYKALSAAIAEAGGKILVPNAFTPAGGGNLLSTGKNDYFNPVSEGVVEFHMQIFNRWGELLFETWTTEPGWDGTYRGSLCKQDVYVYKIKARFFDGEIVEKIGDVTLIR